MPDIATQMDSAASISLLKKLLTKDSRILSLEKNFLKRGIQILFRFQTEILNASLDLIHSSQRNPNANVVKFSKWGRLFNVAELNLQDNCDNEESNTNPGLQVCLRLLKKGMGRHLNEYQLAFKVFFLNKWARFRNRFRQRFHARRGKAIDPETLLDETGARDMIMKKTPCKSNKVVPPNFASTTAVKGDSFVVKDAPAADTTGEGFENLVGKYVSCIIDKAAESLRQASLSNTKPAGIREKSADDIVSLSSSIISQIADIAVTESLTNVVIEADINHSAIHSARPKTVKELMEAFGIVGDDITGDGLPAVSV